MLKNLVIVESPAKAKTIENYLGKDFVVKSSYGHVRDLPKGNKAIDIQNGYKPVYEVTEDKIKVVNDLKKLAKDAQTIWLATDDDREGEAISWHLLEALELDPLQIKRIVFREITKNAILKAIEQPRQIDIDLVNAQQARRILDRLVGFELSPVLWKKVKTGLSAGRVQSVAVRLIVEREREIDKFESESAYKITAYFSLGKNKLLEAHLPKRFATLPEAQDFLERCKNAIFSIKNLEKKPRKKSPAPPFTTSTLQQQASQKLRFSVAQTMSLAQRLYEAGHISYMRTDSENLSEDAIQAATAEVAKSYGEEFVQPRRYKTKSATAQEAHEAIRPTNFAVREAGSDDKERKLYELIWKRATASQMSDAHIEKTVATISISTMPEVLIAEGEVVTFEGFLKVYVDAEIEENDENHTGGMLPPLTIGQILDLNKLLATERFSRPSPRYTEATLVRKLEELGIGRPSTYAPTISTIQKREYVLKDNKEGKERKYNELSLQNNELEKRIMTEIYGTEKQKLFPTEIAMVVNDLLTSHFPNVLDYSFTARVEAQFDQIAQGQTAWQSMIDDFYKEFHKKVEKAEDIERASVSTARQLGNDPVSGKPVSVRLGRYGAFAQLGANEEEAGEKPQYASLKKGQHLENISLEDALELFKLPRNLGEFEGKTMSAAIGRFGPYIKHDSKFYSLPKELDPFSVTETQAVTVILNKREADANKLVKDFGDDIKLLNGRWGVYLFYKGNNVKIPKDKKDQDLSLEDCISIAEADPKVQADQAKKAQAAEKAKKPAAKTKKTTTSEEKPKKATTKTATKTKKTTVSEEKPKKTATKTATKK